VLTKTFNTPKTTLGQLRGVACVAFLNKLDSLRKKPFFLACAIYVKNLHFLHFWQIWAFELVKLGVGLA